MIDLHTHSVFSDGELLPSELIRRMAELGNKGLAITDHADFSNIPDILAGFSRLKEYRDDYEIKVLFGVEITHVPPKLIGRAVDLSIKEGAEIIVVHGETVAEPVKSGTNLAALNEEIDILAHPGLIDEESLQLALENDIFLEITSRKGHCLTNGYVARKAEEFGCKLIINTDAHSPSDLISHKEAETVCKGAGIKDCSLLFENSKKLMEKKLKRV
jgi:histidinol phosphatase-like PHP family hydrolase